MRCSGRSKDQVLKCHWGFDGTGPRRDSSCVHSNSPLQVYTRCIVLNPSSLPLSYRNSPVKSLASRRLEREAKDCPDPPFIAFLRASKGGEQRDSTRASGREKRDQAKLARDYLRELVG